VDDPLLWIALRNVPDLRRLHAHALLQRYGSPPAIFGRAAWELHEHCSKRAALALSRGPDLEAARNELRRARAAGLRVLAPGSPEFPASLGEIPDAPLVLYARGPLSDEPVLAIVGSRRPSVRARHTARQLAAELAADGATIVSGLAYGIDAAAHEGALSVGGRTVAVLASGLERPTPVGNRPLARRILASGGAWLSEYPLGQSYLPFHFPERNRLISGLARATLVVEARERSGTLWTARHALDQGRDLGVVPGPIDSDLCRGSNALLREAAPILDVEDLRVLVGVSPRSSEPEGAPVSETGAGTVAERVLADLRDGPRATDDLVRALCLPAASLAAVLLELELEGRIAREGSRVVLLR
jgi:DNA processing protein